MLFYIFVPHMKVSESPLKQYIKNIIPLDQGPVYIFDKFIITEFNKGTTVDEDCFLNLFLILDSCSVEKKPFGFISNRVNSYAVDARAYEKVAKYAKRFYTSAFVVYSKRMSIATSFEEYIYNTKLSVFSELNEAVQWMYSKFSEENQESA